MPSTVESLFAVAGVIPNGVVRWRAKVPCERSGVYVVSASDDRNYVAREPFRFDTSRQAVSAWLRICPALSVDGISANLARVVQRLSEFWLPDETVLYVGQTTAALQGRLNHFYRHVLGARSPHSGGQWLKLLSCLDELYVHYGCTDKPELAEDYMLRHYCSHVSTLTRKSLRDPERPFPFANLEWPKGHRKRHGLANARLMTKKSARHRDAGVADRAWAQNL